MIRMFKKSGTLIKKNPEVQKYQKSTKKIQNFPKDPDVQKNLEVPKKIPKASLHRKKSGSVTKNLEKEAIHI